MVIDRGAGEHTAPARTGTGGPSPTGTEPATVARAGIPTATAAAVPALPGVARMCAYAALALVAVKPLLDFQGEKAPYDTVDLGAAASAAGAALMAASFAGVLLASRRSPMEALAGPAILAALLLLSLTNLVAAPWRGAIFLPFSLPQPELFGPPVDPGAGIAVDAARLALGFAPVALFSVALLRERWFPAAGLAWVAHGILLGALAHAAVAWLQVAGVVPYTFYFRLPGGAIGRASGGYYHPTSLGGLLLVAVFLCYAVYPRLGWSGRRRYALIALLAATAAITLHRMTMICLLLLVAGFELARLAAMLRRGRIRRRALIDVAGLLAALATAALVVARRWGEALADAAGFLASQAAGALQLGTDAFLRGRGMIWSEYARVWRDLPLDVWLTGIGFEPWNTHNDLLRVAVVWGAVGVLLFALLSGTLFAAAWRRVDREGRWALVCLYAVAVAFGATQRPTAYPYFVWLFVASHLFLVALAPRVPRIAGGEG